MMRVFSMPTFRAWIYTLCGKYDVAGQIYEKVLERNPQRLSLYPALADIYLRQRRCDEYAMKVYKKALETSLPNRQRQAILGFIVQN